MPDEDETLDPTPPHDLPSAPPAPPPPAPAQAQPPALPTPVPAPPKRGLSEEERARIEDHKARALKKQLKDLFGTDDPAEVERIRNEYRSKAEKHDQLLQAEEQRKREQMTEVQRLQEDLQRVTSERDQLKAELDSLKREKVVMEQDAKIRSIAIRYVDPKFLKYSMQEFGEYVRSLADADRKRVDEKRTDLWFKNFARANENMALKTVEAPSPAAPPTEQAKPPSPGTPPPIPRRLPAGAKPAGTPPKPNVPPPADPLAGKTPKPGLPNSMNKEELKIYAQRQGIRYQV